MSYLDINNSEIDCGTAKPEKPNQPVLKVLTYVETNLPEFIEENFGKDNFNEDNYTEKLCDILNLNASEKPFWFHWQNIEKQSKGHDAKIDVGVKTKEKIIVGNREFKAKDRYFAFEAKILGVKESYREQEYLVGKDNKGSIKHCGGVERFKRNIHCQDLTVVGMFGYILKEDSAYWFNMINSWILDFAENAKDDTIFWNESEVMVLNEKHDKFCKLKSSHHRNENNRFTIYHFWCQLN